MYVRKHFRTLLTKAARKGHTLLCFCLKRRFGSCAWAEMYKLICGRITFSVCLKLHESEVNTEIQIIERNIVGSVCSVRLLTLTCVDAKEQSRVSKTMELTELTELNLK
jgi:hypothetical protein